MRQLTVPIRGTSYEINLTERGTRRDGRKVWAARCRIPVAGSMAMAVSVSSFPAVRDRSEDGATGPMLEGVASSTSIDWHGTEMSSRALEGMAKQFKSGVAYVPSHREDEWDEVFGRTVDAKIERGNVAALGDKSGGPGNGEVLRVTTELYMDNPRAQRLVKLIERGQTVGWSIGGWFTEMEVVTNEDDEVERMIIHDVELDHLATTRRPSNPDSWISELSRNVSDAMAASRAEDEDDEEEEDEDAEEAEEAGAEADESEGEEAEIGEEEGDEDEAEDDESEGEDEALDEAEDDSNLDEEDDERELDEDDDERELDEDDEDDLEEVAEEDEAEEEPAAEEEEAEDQEAEDEADDLFDDEPPNAEEEEEEDDEDEDEDEDERAVSGSTSLPLAEDGLGWDWGTQAANEVLGADDWKRYRKAHFWYDTDNPEVRASYKLPFARVVDGDLKAVWAGVKAAMAALNGARGGVDVSDDDRAAIHKKIATYYSRFDKGEPPPLARSRPNRITPPSGGLDIAPPTGEYSSKVAKAHRSRRPPEHTSPEQEAAVGDTRNDKTTAPSAGSPDVAATLASMEQLLVQLASGSRSKASDNNPKPTKADDTEAASLQARISDLEGLVTKLAGMPQRQGRQHVGAARASTPRGVSALVQRAQSELGDSSALVLVAQDQADRRAADKSTLPSRGQLEADLRAVLHAAMADGVITDPDARSSWR